MPDGKADRHILPSNSYRSGLRAGRAAERTRAVEVFAKLIEQENLANGSEAERLKLLFAEMLKSEETKL